MSRDNSVLVKADSVFSLKGVAIRRAPPTGLSRIRHTRPSAFNFLDSCWQETPCPEQLRDGVFLKGVKLPWGKQKQQRTIPARLLRAE